MYKVIASLWSTPKSANQTHIRVDPSIDEDSWVFVSDTIMVTSSVKKNDNNNNLMTNSWIASPPLIKNDGSSIDNVHHFNPIENLLIEHASMSVYEQIASKTRNKRQKNIVNDNTLDEHVEDVEEEDEDDEDDRTLMDYQNSTIISIHNRNLNISTNSSITTLESSTSSLTAHHRHLHRLHQRRKRSNKVSTSKLILSNSIIDDSKLFSNKNIDRQRLNYTRPPKIPLQQSSRLNN